MSNAFRRLGAARPHLVRGSGGLAGEIAKLREDTAVGFDAVEASTPVVNVITPSSAAVSAAGIKGAFASTAAPVTLTGADFDGTLAPGTGPALLNSPKRVTITVAGSGTPANWTGGTITVTGTDVNGNVLEEDVTSAAGAGTTTTVNYFATVEQIELPTASGTGASLTIGAAADTASIATLNSAVTAQVVDFSDATLWNRARIGNRRLPYARRLSFVFSSSADWDATTIVVRGKDANGELISSDILIANGGGTTVTTDKFFTEFSFVIPAQSGAGGTCAVGPEGTSVGLTRDPISDVEAVAVQREASRANSAGAWSVPTAGVIDTASVTNAGPYGRYTPDSSVPIDGVRQYLLAYYPAAA